MSCSPPLPSTPMLCLPELSGHTTDQLTCPLPTLSVHTWRVNCGGKPGLEQCDHPHTVGGWSYCWQPAISKRSKPLHICLHRLTFRYSPCGAIKGSGFSVVTPSLHLCMMDSFHVRNLGTETGKNESDRYRIGYENIRTIASLVWCGNCQLDRSVFIVHQHTSHDTDIAILSVRLSITFRYQMKTA